MVDMKTLQEARTTSQGPESSPQAQTEVLDSLRTDLDRLRVSMISSTAVQYRLLFNLAKHGLPIAKELHDKLSLILYDLMVKDLVDERVLLPNYERNA